VELITFLGGIMILMSIVFGVLFVAFGQLTVRKLRKNPATKYALGVEFYSGGDIFNVAGALSRPAWITKRFKASRLCFLAADADVLYQHTTRFDRVLARVFWFTWTISGIFIIIISLMNLIGLELLHRVIDIRGGMGEAPG
jgi:hypothetical protein